MATSDMRNDSFLAGRRTSILTALLLVSGAAFATECTPPPELQTNLHADESAENYAAIGQYFGDMDQHACAVQAWASAFKLEPGSARFAYMLGLNLFFSSQPEPALSALQESARLNPNELQTHLLLANVLQQLHRGPEAAGEWQAALDLDPTSALALDGLAKSYLASGNLPGVVQLLRPATRDENLAVDLALAYQRMGNLDEAKATLTTALDASPSSLLLANTLALIYLSQDQHEMATSLLERQLALHPGDLDAQIDYFRVLAVNDQLETGAPLGKKLLARAPHNFDVLYLNGLLERESGDYAAAKVHLEEAVQLDPNHPDCRYNYGVALARLHQPAEAREQFEKAIQLGWNSPEIHYDLGNVYRALGETDLAAAQMKLYQQATQAKEQRTLARSKAAQADQEMQSGDRKAAIQNYREACEAWPGNALYAYKLALALDADGNLAEERTMLDRIIKNVPGYAPAQQQVGALAARSGDQAAAEQHYRTAVNSDPSLTTAWIGLASTLAAESKLAEAQDALKTALRLDPENTQAQALSQQLNRPAATPDGTQHP
jgi:tetratricopeptide (TPR) repeat protein